MRIVDGQSFQFICSHCKSSGRAPGYHVQSHGQSFMLNELPTGWARGQRKACEVWTDVYLCDRCIKEQVQ